MHDHMVSFNSTYGACQYGYVASEVYIRLPHLQHMVSHGSEGIRQQAVDRGRHGVLCYNNSNTLHAQTSWDPSNQVSRPINKPISGACCAQHTLSCETILLTRSLQSMPGCTAQSVSFHLSRFNMTFDLGHIRRHPPHIPDQASLACSPLNVLHPHSRHNVCTWSLKECVPGAIINTIRVPGAQRT